MVLTSLVRRPPSQSRVPARVPTRQRPPLEVEAVVQPFGTLASSSASHARDPASDGIRQSPRGDSEPPATTLGPLGMAERLNWLAKKRLTKTSIQRRMVARS